MMNVDIFNGVNEGVKDFYFRYDTEIFSYKYLKQLKTK